MKGGPKLTWATVYQGTCGKNHPFTPENTNAYQRGERIHRICRACAKKRKDEKPSGTALVLAVVHNGASPELLAYWQHVAEGGKAALVKEATARLDALAGPYAVGVMPDDVFWGKCRAVFAGRALPFEEGRV